MQVDADATSSPNWRYDTSIDGSRGLSACMTSAGGGSQTDLTKFALLRVTPATRRTIRLPQFSVTELLYIISECT